jgi:tRNA-specific 2-thiouridylase
VSNAGEVRPGLTGSPTSPTGGTTSLSIEPDRASAGESQTVIVAMSGGVDSSVAAALLVEQGCNVIGITMKTFCYSGTTAGSRTCCGLDGIADARRVADALGIAHYVFDMEESFTHDVIDDFVNEYAVGRTPNPCVRCNSTTKIPDLLRRGRAFGADAIATGHYARIDTDGGMPRLMRGVDRNKDQTYFLWDVPSFVLSRLRFPVGALTKPEVRDRARSLGLVTADKPESQEICFVPDGDYAGFLASRLGADHAALQPGPIVSADGRELGTHAGYARYTIGQRRGLGGGFGQPLYVLDVRPATRQVVVGTPDQLDANGLALTDVNWLADPPRAGDRVHVQVRHRARAASATVVSIDGSGAEFRFDEGQRAVTPGQSGVVYSDDECVLGGGRIRRLTTSI